jgi:hypothetical protein
MRKVVLTHFAVTIDGYTGEEGTEFYRLWESMATDNELEEYFVAKLRRAGTHFMGRVTYQNMAAHWATSAKLVAPVMNDIPKVAFCKTLKEPTGRCRESRRPGSPVTSAAAGRHGARGGGARRRGSCPAPGGPGRRPDRPVSRGRRRRKAATPGQSAAAGGVP